MLILFSVLALMGIFFAIMAYAIFVLRRALTEQRIEHKQEIWDLEKKYEDFFVAERQARKDDAKLKSEVEPPSFKDGRPGLYVVPKLPTN